MNRRRLLFFSLGLNVALAIGWFYATRPRPVVVSSADTGVANNVVSRDRIIPVIRKQFFAWNELESTNYDIYVANLRDIACPEETIHDIILADVNKLYDQRKASEEHSPEHFKALDDERNALLTRLLGPDWDASEKKAGFAFSKVAFTDPLLNELPPEVRARVQDILASWSQQAVAGVRESAELEQKMRLELAGILSPPQIEELLSRYSANAVNLNNQLASLQFFKTTPTEFRNLFRATDAFDLQLRLLGDAGDPAAQAQRKNIEQQREMAIRIALGTKRYAEYVQLQDPDYRAALAAAQASGAPPQAAQTLLEVNQETAIQTAIVQADPSLTETQKLVATKQAELEQLKALVQAQGQDLPPDLPPMPPNMVLNRQVPLLANDSVKAIADRYQLTVEDLRNANPGVDFTTIKPGEIINIPTVTPAQ